MSLQQTLERNNWREMKIVILCFVIATVYGASARAEVLESDSEQSYFVAVVRRAGLLGFLGHEHGVLATKWRSEIKIDRENILNANIKVSVDAASLAIDTRRARDLADLKSKGPDQDDQPKILARMLGQYVLDVEHFPTIEFESEKIQKSAEGDILLKGKVALHGVTRSEEIPLQVRRLSTGKLSVSGDMRFKLSNYGISPPSTAGLVNVSDKMELRFRFVEK